MYLLDSRVKRIAISVEFILFTSQLNIRSVSWVLNINKMLTQQIEWNEDILHFLVLFGNYFEHAKV